MASAKFQGNRFKIDGEIAENHATLADHFKFDGEYYNYVWWANTESVIIIIVGDDTHWCGIYG